MRFIKSNPHPKGKKIGDCVIRAIAIAEAKRWIDVYKELCEIGANVYNLPNSKDVYEIYLLKNGWTKQRMPRHANDKRMKLSEFADKNPNKLFIASVVKHLTVVDCGRLLDIWDCGSKCIGNYFTK